MRNAYQILKRSTFLAKKQIHMLFIVTCLFFCTTATSAQTGAIQHVHDPVIIKAGEDYYIFSTGNRIAMRRSKDLYDWDYIGEVFGAIPAWGQQEVPGVSNIWAPDIFFKDGTYYLYYSLSTFGSNRSRIGLATNTTLDPDDSNYQWVDQGKVVESNNGNNYNAIDPNIFRDNDGSIWMSFGSFWSGIQLTELDTTTMKRKEGSQIARIASRPGSTAIEAPFIIKKNGFYYLFVSFDSCCQGVNSTYKIMVGRAEEVTGPYFAKNGSSMLSGGGTLVRSGDDRWRGTGHCAVFTEDSLDWLVHHAYDANRNGIPTLQIRQLQWDSDGWPVATATTPVNVRSRPGDFRLHQNYPNPVNPSTNISYSVARKSYVSLRIYNLRGQEVATLFEGIREPGDYDVSFKADGLSSGVYLYRMTSENYAESRKLILLK